MDKLTDGSIAAATIQAGNVAPRVTEGDIAANIVGEYYFTAHDGVAGVQALAAAAGSVHEITGLAPVVVVRAHPRLSDVTLCVLVTRTAFVVVGTSVPVAPENFDAELGRKYAREDAIRQLGPLMGYALRQALHDSTPRTPIYPKVAAAVVTETEATRLATLLRKPHETDVETLARHGIIDTGPTTNAVHKPNEPQDPPDPVPPPPGGPTGG